MDVATITQGGVGAAACLAAKYAYTLIRAGQRGKREEASRDAKYTDDCEKRYAELSAEIRSMRTSYETNTVNALLESTKSLTTAAEVQRDGNNAMREQTRVLTRVCDGLEALTGNNPKDRTPIDGTPAIQP